MTTVERLYQLTREMPEPMLAELVDFAEFLRQKNPVITLPANGLSLLALGGGLENSTTFAGNPVQIQERMRNEWD